MSEARNFLRIPACDSMGWVAQAGPVCFRGLNQNAVNHTIAAAVV
jgi:hypothetical protein